MMETLSELLALCEGNLPVTGGFHWQMDSYVELCYEPKQTVEQTSSNVMHCARLDMYTNRLYILLKWWQDIALRHIIYHHYYNTHCNENMFPIVKQKWLLWKCEVFAMLYYSSSSKFISEKNTTMIQE